MEFVRRMTDSLAVTELTILSAKSATPKRRGRNPAVAQIKYCTRIRTHRQAVDELSKRLLGGTGGSFYYDDHAAPGPPKQSEDHQSPGLNGHTGRNSRSPG